MKAGTPTCPKLGCRLQCGTDQIMLMAKKIGNWRYGGRQRSLEEPSGERLESANAHR